MLVTWYRLGPKRQLLHDTSSNVSQRVSADQEFHQGEAKAQLFFSENIHVLCNEF